MPFKAISIIAAISGLCVVVLSALVAHGFKAYLTNDELSHLDTALVYQGFHTLILLLVVAIFRSRPRGYRLASIASIFFILGIVLFSGLLYLDYLVSFGMFHSFIPVGGTCFMIGWVMLIAAFFRMDH